MKDLEQAIFCVISVVVLAALMVLAYENSRLTERLSADVREMRTSMGEAGYLPIEPLSLA